MKLWSAMQRIESLRYQVERLQAHAEWGSPEFQLLMADIERQVEDLAAETMAMLEGHAPQGASKAQGVGSANQRAA